MTSQTSLAPAAPVATDPTLLVAAARALRLGVDDAGHSAHPPGAYATFGLARLLDAIAFSMHVDGTVHHTVAADATEIAHQVVDHLLAGARTDARHR